MQQEATQLLRAIETVLADNNVQLSDADLGLQSKDKLPKAIAEQAFALPLNSATMPVPVAPTAAASVGVNQPK